MRISLAFIFSILAVLQTETSYCQDEFLYTSDGRTILRQRELIQYCLTNLHKPKTDQTALSICQCQTSLINRQFTYRQFKKYTHNKIIDVGSLIKEDSLVVKKIEECYKSSGKVTLLMAESDAKEYIEACANAIKKNTERKLDSIKIEAFCSCQLQLVKSKKISDAQMEVLENPNSLLFYEMLYKCGNPFSDQGDEQRNWSSNSKNDIRGPEADTVSILSLSGMTYIKLKIGSTVQMWLFDTGASDFLINKEMESTLKKEGIIGDENYIGMGQYEMANGLVDSCRRYKINNIRIGHFSIDNVIIAVSEKARRIIAGKTLLNKFSKWALNNEDSKLILWK